MDSLHKNAILGHPPGPLDSPVLKPRQLGAHIGCSPTGCSTHAPVPSSSIIDDLGGDATLPYEPLEPFCLQTPCRQHGFQSMLQRVHQPVPQQLFRHASCAGQHNSDSHDQKHQGDHFAMKPVGNQGRCSPPPFRPLHPPFSPSDSTQHFSPAKCTSPQSGNTSLPCHCPSHPATPSAHHTTNSPPMPAPTSTLHTSPTHDGTPTSPTASIEPAEQRAPPPVRKRAVARRASPSTPTRSMPSTPGPPPWCVDNINKETMPLGGSLLYADGETSRACAPTATAVAATADPPQTPPPPHATHTHAYTCSHLCASTNINTLTPTTDNNRDNDHHKISSSAPEQSNPKLGFNGVLPTGHGCGDAAAGVIHASGVAPSPSTVPHGSAAEGAVAVPGAAVAAAAQAAVGHAHHAMPSPHRWSSWGRHAAATTNTPNTFKSMDCTSFRLPAHHNHPSTPQAVDQQQQDGQHHYQQQQQQQQHDAAAPMRVPLQQQQHQQHQQQHQQQQPQSQLRQQQPGVSSTMNPSRPTALSPPPPSLLRCRPNPFSPPSQHVSARKKLRFDNGTSSCVDDTPSGRNHGVGAASGAQRGAHGAGSGISNSSSKSGGNRSGEIHHAHAPQGGTPPAAVGWGSRGVYSRQGVRSRMSLLSRLEDAASEGGTPSKGVAMGGGGNVCQGGGAHPGLLEGAGKRASVGRSLLSRLEEEVVEGGGKTQEAGSRLKTAKAGNELGPHGVDGKSRGGLCRRKGQAVDPIAVECEGECSRTDAVDVRRSGTGGEFVGDEATAAGAEGYDDDGLAVPPMLPFSLLRARPFFSSSNSLASPSQSPAGPGRAPTVAAATPSPSSAARQLQQQQQQQGRGVRWFAGLGCLKSEGSDRGTEMEEEAEEVDGMSVLAARGAGRPESRLSSPSQASLLGSFYGSTGKAV
ncbi:hypothetical protein DUNSADRAFT_4838 [Dunaliella salina]|uniref:Uncharacterized protein n=1 Tax=Dunaliella salina TaxID=3046 RepID=A0ABQ7GR74_DUNSA|nr:hypothetical protein DUNSADRAFT_4838 [Dunaliella salina]|eukprot:KAF5837115.1 hypothetical protein DUNSADRAFT_4838 [Dunaliella salina]